MLTHGGCSHPVTVDPPAVEDQVRHRLRMTSGPPHREWRTEGGADQVEAVNPDRGRDRVQNLQLQLDDVRAAGCPGQAAPRSVVSHESPTVRQALVELALGRQRPPKLEMGHPPRHVDRNRPSRKSDSLTAA